MPTPLTDVPVLCVILSPLDEALVRADSYSGRVPINEDLPVTAARTSLTATLDAWIVRHR